MRKLLAHRKQFSVFVLGGVLCALIDIGVMQGLISAGVHFGIATTVGFAVGLLVNYFFHTFLTFKAQAAPANFVRFMCVVAVNYGITLGCVAASVALLTWALPGKIASLPLVAVNGFLLSKYWIYK
jgi:putative flippase GtrA